MPVPPNRLGRLKVVLDLGQIGIGIAVVHQGVQEFHRFPDTHLATIQRTVLLLFAQHEIVSLVRVIKPVEFTHNRRGGIVVFSEAFLIFAGLVTVGNSILPLAETLERSGSHTYPELILRVNCVRICSVGAIFTRSCSRLRWWACRTGRNGAVQIGTERRRLTPCLPSGLQSLLRSGRQQSEKATLHP